MQEASASAGSSITKKLVEIMARVPSLDKDGFNQAQSYKFLSEKQVKAAIQPLLVEYGLILVPVDSEVVSIETTEGSKQKVVVLKLTFDFCDIETGETRRLSWIGSGADSGDKHVYKAVTGALKSIWTSTLLIPTDLDPEGDDAIHRKPAPQPRSKKAQDPNSLITDGQASRLYALCNKVGMDKGRAKQVIGNYGYESSKEIRVKDYEAICREIDPSLEQA